MAMKQSALCVHNMVITALAICHKTVFIFVHFTVIFLHFVEKNWSLYVTDRNNYTFFISAYIIWLRCFILIEDLNAWNQSTGPFFKQNAQSVSPHYFLITRGWPGGICNYTVIRWRKCHGGGRVCRLFHNH